MSTTAPLDPALLSVTIGRDESFVFTLARADVELDEGSLAGVVFCVKRYADQPDAEAPVRLTLGAGLTRLVDADADTMQIRADLPRATTAALSPLISYFWDVAVLDGDGRLRAVAGLSGRLSAVPGIATSAT